MSENFTEDGIESCASNPTFSGFLRLLNQKFPKDRLSCDFWPKIGSAVRTSIDLEVRSMESSRKVGTPPKNFRPDCFIGFRATGPSFHLRRWTAKILTGPHRDLSYERSYGKMRLEKKRAPAILRIFLFWSCSKKSVRTEIIHLHEKILLY